MHEVHLQLSDQVYDRAMRRALEAGFNSVDEFIAEVVTDELVDDSENLDRLFTPERLAMIDAAALQINRGQFLTAQDADVELARRRMEWQQKNRA